MENGLRTHAAMGNNNSDCPAPGAAASNPAGTPRISIVVPVCNAAAWIESCITGLANQDYDPSQYEIILVDNNSSDASRMLIRRHERVRLLQEAVQSSYAARNRGVRESRGELLAFTDADCVPARNWLSVIDAAMRNPRTQVVLGSRAPGAASATAELVAAYDDARVRYILENRRARSYFAFTNNMAVRRSAFERYGPFDAVARGGDTLFLRRLASGEGPEAAEWIADMCVRHLEFRSAWVYLKKNFIYARARNQTAQLEQCENLSSAECFRIFLNVSRGRPAWAKMALALALSTGRLSWAAGSLVMKPQ
jgi:glycosyltransferase involved in cell wall biosynthesis